MAVAACADSAGDTVAGPSEGTSEQRILQARVELGRESLDQGPSAANGRDAAVGPGDEDRRASGGLPEGLL